MKVYTDIDLRKNELQNAVIHALSSAPSGKMGQLYYNTNEKAMYQHNGTTWVRVGVLYDMTLGDKSGNSIPITLVGSDGSLDSVTLTGAGGATLEKSGNTITITTADTNTTYTFSRAVSPTKFTITVTPSTGSAQTIEIPLADATNAGLMSPSQVSKLEGIEDGAEPNQNAFSRVMADSTAISASTESDTFTLEAGSNITLIPDTTNKKVTISASNSTYPTGTSQQLDDGSSTTSSLWSPKTLHDYVGGEIDKIDLGYECDATTTLLTSETVTSTLEDGYGWGELSYQEQITADKLLVEFDGTPYIVSKYINDVTGFDEFGAPSDGSDFSEYPFGLMLDGQSTYVATENPGTYNISVSTYNTSVITTECFKEAVKSASGGQTTFYGSSDTTSGDATKAVTIDGFPTGDIPTGTIIGVYFSNGNTAATPTLNINQTGDVGIHVGASSVNVGTNTLKWTGGSMLFFMYVPYRWELISIQTSGASAPRGAKTWYGTCSTTASTVAKAVTAPNYVLTRGSLVVITFSTANTANAPTLNVNSTGAKAIYKNNTVTSATNPLMWSAGETLTFMYSGSYYYYLGSSKPKDEDARAAIDDLAYRKQDNLIPLTITLTASGWSNNTQTVTATGVDSSSVVIVTPAPASISDYTSAGIYCSAQGTNTLTFTCATVPTSAITVNVLIVPITT